MTLALNRTMDEAAAWLRISRRALQDVVRRHPFYFSAGRRKLFSEAHLVAIRTALEEEARAAELEKRVAQEKGRRRCRSASSIPAPAAAPTTAFAGRIAASTLIEAQSLLTRRRPARSLRRWQADIECGAVGRRGEPVFLDALVAYVKAGGDDRFLGRYDPDTGQWSGIAKRLAALPLSAVDQATIDTTAIALLPEATPATRNRQVYTPISAVLKHAGVDFRLRRPKGWRGRRRTDWLSPDEAFRFIRLAGEVDAELGILLTLLLYTGLRLGEALALTCDRVDLGEASAFVPATKNGDPRVVFLPSPAVVALASLPRGLDRRGARVFRFTKSGRLYQLLRRTRAAAGPGFAVVGFHTFRHTRGAWMRRYGGLDTSGLVATGAWRDRQSAAR